MKSYGWRNSILIINTVPVSGFDEGNDVVQIGRIRDSGDDKVGIDGEMTHRVSSDRRGELKFRLMQSSSSNAVLGAIVFAAENGVFIPVAFSYRDTLSGDTANGTQGYFTGPARLVRGEDPNAQEWTLRTERLDIVYGATL